MNDQPIFGGFSKEQLDFEKAAFWWKHARIVALYHDRFIFGGALDFSTIGAIQHFGSSFVEYVFPAAYFNWCQHGFR